MKQNRKQLLSTAATLPLLFGLAVGVATMGAAVVTSPSTAVAACNPCNPCAAKNACNPCNPCAANACNPCNPCAAKNACNPCNPCNPCAAKKACNPCNPCAANACNPCNPCAGGAVAVSQKCRVPRLAAAYACNPCAARKACNPCNPCAAGQACNPCNPCAAGQACNPCNPCAAGKACNPCNPCAAGKACNPCNPCAAGNACNPCNPCGASGSAELTGAESVEAYSCLIEDMVAGYSKSGARSAREFASWSRFSSRPYVSDTHGARYVNNYANSAAKAGYNKYEDVGRMPVGSILAKDSFSANSDGSLAAGPLFLMVKMRAGFAPDRGDWKYSMIMPDGSVFGVTKGLNSAGMEFCNDCHAAVEDQDYLYFLPDDLRVSH